MNQRFDKVDEKLQNIENSIALMVGLSLYNSPLISDELKPKLNSKLNTQINNFVTGIMDKEPNIINLLSYRDASPLEKGELERLN